MRHHSTFWWASILLSSVATGGGSFVLLGLLTDWPILGVALVSLAFMLVGDVVLALLMEAVSPTHVTVGPGERRYNAEPPRDVGTVMTDFEDGHGKVSIRGETWRARQMSGSSERLEVGTAIRAVAREGLTLVVAAAEPRQPVGGSEEPEPG